MGGIDRELAEKEPIGVECISLLHPKYGLLSGAPHARGVLDASATDVVCRQSCALSVRTHRKSVVGDSAGAIQAGLVVYCQRGRERFAARAILIRARPLCVNGSAR